MTAAPIGERSLKLDGLALGYGVGVELLVHDRLELLTPDDPEAPITVELLAGPS